VVKAKSALRGASVLLLQLETPLNTVQAAADLAVAAGARVILNPAPARPLPDKLLRQVYLLTPNESEAGLLTGMTVTSPATAAKAAGKLLARGVRHVIITLGARGALIAGSEGHALIPAFKVKPVDTTAAGDVFNGTLAVALAERRTLAEAARFACAAAALSVTRVGAQTSIPRRREIERLLVTSSRSAKTPPTRRRSPAKTARASLR
jgi:ribokinase